MLQTHAALFVLSPTVITACQNIMQVSVPQEKESRTKRILTDEGEGAGMIHD